ncbi:MAG: hypothetical protein R3E03_03420 [Novosphingobium sp.]
MAMEEPDGANSLFGADSDDSLSRRRMAIGAVAVLVVLVAIWFWSHRDTLSKDAAATKDQAPWSR